MTDPQVELGILKRRLRAIEMLVLMVLEGDEMVTKDERHEPELRDVKRMAKGHVPRTKAGEQVWEATDPE